MCGRFDTSHLNWADIHAQLSHFGTVKTPPMNLEPNPDVRPTTRQLIARLDEDGTWALEAMRWSLIPFFYKGRVKPSARGAGDGFKLTTFNCRTEPFTGEIDPATGQPYKKPPTYAGPFKARRCIVPASAWWEWRKGDKVQCRLSRADGRAIWFAGLWDTATTVDEGEVRSFTIMTGPSSGALFDCHSRAPVILEEEDWATWLDPSQDAAELLKAVRPERFEIVAAA